MKPPWQIAWSGPALAIGLGLTLTVATDEKSGAQAPLVTCARK
jgi:hypothetical protein